MNSPDFVILCYQRSGSHLLATALNSHPDIACGGEAGRRARMFPKFSTGSIRGCIVMYNRIAILRRYKPGKVIHLVRSPYAIARSILINERRRLESVKEHKAHFTRDEDLPEVQEPSHGDIRTRGEGIAICQNVVRNLLTLPVLEVRYEQLCGDVDVETLLPMTSELILRFLGVDPLPLITNLRKG